MNGEKCTCQVKKIACATPSLAFSKDGIIRAIATETVLARNLSGYCVLSRIDLHDHHRGNNSTSNLATPIFCCHLTSTLSSQRKQRMSGNRQPRESWRNAERHYCTVCNAWMGSDRQSILLHENGKKHIENQEKAMQQKRKEKKVEEEKNHVLMASLQKMERAALLKNSQDYGFTSSSASASSSVLPHPISSRTAQVPSLSLTKQPPRLVVKEEKEKWRERKKQRERAEVEPCSGEQGMLQVKRQKLLPGEGHYAYDGKTYLEGLIFGELLEEDMPVQIWIGSQLASANEKRLLERERYWVNAIVASVSQNKVHVAYLAAPTDSAETVEKNVPLDRIRIILGADEVIPETLEEARIMAMGGEDVNVKASEKPEVDEATGLSGWSTFAIKRTTVRQEFREERARLKEERKQTTEARAASTREAEARKLEELKVANADDSALGSVYFAELGREVNGYKGVDISASGEDKLTVQDTVGRMVSSCKASFGFKKTKKKFIKNPSRRTTSADDD